VAGAGRPLLECEQITVRFGGLFALQRVDLVCFPGEILGLIGPNGSGKTTLFNVVTGMLAPRSGRVRFEGRDITGQAPHRVCHAGIARTYQLVRPFGSLSARDNVRAGIVFGGGEHGAHSSREEADRLLEIVGLAGCGDRPASALTLVQRKRLEVARALGSGPRLLLLDEVAAGLNPAETETMLQLIGDLRDSGLTIILIEHNMRVVMGLSDRVVVLHHGEKLAEGSPHEVSRHPKVLSAYLGPAEASHAI
jgi:branched-chain amino acid transport system ATP-binding protein